MSSPETLPQRDSRWPSFSLRYAFNPDGIEGADEFAPDELVVFDPSRSSDGAWLSANRGAYVAIEDVQ